MSKVSSLDLDLDFIIKLREKKWSYQKLADRFKTSKSTIKRRLNPHEPNRAVLAFAAKLEKLMMEVPDEYCRKELNRTINELRTYQAASRQNKLQKIITSIETGAWEIEHIAEESNLSVEETEKLLDDLIVLERVQKRARGGKLNCGRKTKYHYCLI